MAKEKTRDEQVWPAAKISPPRPRILVPRARLLDPLNSAATTGRVILVVAPGGSGKTSLLAGWAQQAPTPIAWYGLDTADRDMQRLVSGLCQAVERAVPGSTRQAQAALDSGASEIAAVGMLLGALEARPLTLVLDDFQHLDDLPEATALWQHLLRFRPPTLALVILSRSMPLLGFAMLAAMDALRGFGRTDLSFDAAETAELLAAHSLDPRGAAQLAARTDGWPVGMLLLARTAPGGMRLLHARADALMEQLGAEVLDGLPDGLRRFLLESAALGPVEPDDADAILGRNDSAAQYAEAAARELFVIQEGASYRYHDLFAEHFVNVLKMEDPGRLRAIRHAAADWWIERNDLPRALGLLAVDEDWPALAAMLERERRTLEEGRLWGTVLEHVERLPTVFRTPRLLALCGLCRRERGEYKEALAYADAGMAAAESDRDWLSPAHMHAEILMRAGRYREAAAGAEAALAVAERIDWTAAVFRLLELRGLARLHLGEFVEGRGDLLTALAGHEAAGDVNGEARTVTNLATQLIEAGHVREAEEYLARASAMWKRASRQLEMGHVHNSRALLYAFSGDPIAARTEAEQAIALTREVGHPLSVCDATATLADVCVDAGDAVEADRQAQIAMELAERLNAANAYNAALRARIAAALARRDRAGARRLLEDARPLAVTSIDIALLDLYEGTLALRSRAHSRAIDTLGRAAKRLEAVSRPHNAARAYLLRAEAFLATGVVGRAEEALNLMAALVLPLGCEGYLRPAARMARQVIAERHLLRRVRRETRQLLDSFAAAVPSLAVVNTSDDEESPIPIVQTSPFGEGRIILAGTLLNTAALPPKARELLFYAARAGGPIPRAQLLEVIWEDEQRAPQALWDASRHLRRLLGERGWILRGGAYALTPQIRDDGVQFDNECRVALGRGADLVRLAAAECALKLAGTGGYLEWCDSMWAAAERARVTRDIMAVTLVLAGLYESMGRTDDALATCKRAVTIDPLDEAPRLALVRTLATQGLVQQAIQEYRAYRTLLREELDTEPSMELRQMASLLGRRG